jgi:hypothetical protein
MKTIKRSELDGVAGWLSIDGTLRICSMGKRWHRDGFCLDTRHTDDECKHCGDTPLTGDSLIAALRERGVEAVEEERPPTMSKGDLQVIAFVIGMAALGLVVLGVMWWIRASNS